MSYASEQGVLNAQWNAAAEAATTEQARRAPHVLMRPRIFPDGNAWCALYGDNIQEGVVGFGETPEAAAADFDLAWRQQSKAAFSSPLSPINAGDAESSSGGDGVGAPTYYVRHPDGSYSEAEPQPARGVLGTDVKADPSLPPGTVEARDSMGRVLGRIDGVLGTLNEQEADRA